MDVSHAEALSVGISHSVCFPWVTSLYYDLQELAKSGNVVLSGNGIGDAPGLAMTPLVQKRYLRAINSFLSTFMVMAFFRSLLRCKVAEGVKNSCHSAGSRACGPVWIWECVIPQRGDSSMYDGEMNLG